MKNIYYILLVAVVLQALAGCGKPSTDRQEDPRGLFRAILSGNYSDAEDQIERGASINENIGTTENKITPLLAAICLEEFEIAELLLKHGAGGDHSSFEGFTPEQFSSHILGPEHPLTLNLKERI